MEINFRDVNIERREYSLDDFDEGMVVYADVGKRISDKRAVQIRDIDEENEELVVILGRARMDGPYHIPPERVRGIIR